MDDNFGAKFKVDISDLKANLTAANRKIKETESEFRLASAGLDDWSRSEEGLSAKIKSLNTIIALQEDKVESLKKRYAELVKDGMNESSDAAVKLRTRINDEEAALEKNKKQTNDLKEALNDLKNGANDSGKEIDDLGESAKKTANDGFTVFKGVVSNLITDTLEKGISKIKEFSKEMINVGIDFTSSMAEVQAISGANDAQLEQLTEKARELGSTTKFTATEASQAFKYMALAGWDVQSSIDGISGILDLAASSGMDLAAASDAVTDYLSAFGLQAKDSAYLADLLSFAQSNANTSASQLVDAYGNAAATLSAAGQDVETVTALLSMMANVGLKGSEAGTALAAVMRDITAKMEDGAIAIGDTTVKVADSNGNFRDLTDILVDVEKATAGLGTAERAAAVSQTFTSRSIKGLNLILKSGAAATADFEEALRKSGGTAQKTAKVMQDNLGGDITKLKSEVEGLQLDLFDELEPTLRSMGETVSKRVIPAVKKFIQSLEKKGVFEKFANGIAWVAENLDTIVGVAGTALKAFLAFKGISVLVTTFKTVGSAFSALAALIAANPVGAAIVGITTAVAGLTIALNSVEEAKSVSLTSAEELAAEVAVMKEKVEASSQAWRDFKSTKEEALSAELGETNYLERLAGELDTLVDSNGKVIGGYEARVNYIVSKLSEATGVEISLVDGQIRKYDELVGKLKETFAAKKAAAIVQSEEEMFTEALKETPQASAEYLEAQKEFDETEKELTYQKMRRDAAQYQLDQLEKKYSQLLENGGATRQEEKSYLSLQGQYQDAINDAAEEIKTAEIAKKDAESALATAKAHYEGLLDVQAIYEKDATALASGTADDIASINARYMTSFYNGEKFVTQGLQEQLEAAKLLLNTYKKRLLEGAEGYTQAMVEEQAENVRKLEEQIKAETPTMEATGKDFGAAFGEGYIPAVKAESEKFSGVAQPKNKDMVVSSFWSTGYESGKGYARGFEAVSLGDIIGSSVSSAVKSATALIAGSGVFRKAGEDTLDGYISGLDLAAARVTKKIVDVATDISNKFKKVLGIASPSTVFEGYGKNTFEGYENGAEKQSRRTLEKLRGIASDISGVGSSMTLGAASFGGRDVMRAEPSRNVTIYQTNNYTQSHDDYELYRSMRDIEKAVRAVVRG